MSKTARGVLGVGHERDRPATIYGDAICLSTRTAHFSGAQRASLQPPTRAVAVSFPTIHVVGKSTRKHSTHTHRPGWFFELQRTPKNPHMNAPKDVSLTGASHTGLSGALSRVHRPEKGRGDGIVHSWATVAVAQGNHGSVPRWTNSRCAFAAGHAMCACVWTPCADAPKPILGARCGVPFMCGM